MTSTLMIATFVGLSIPVIGEVGALPGRVSARHAPRIRHSRGRGSRAFGVSLVRTPTETLLAAPLAAQAVRELRARLHAELRNAFRR